MHTMKTQPGLILRLTKSSLLGIHCLFYDDVFKK